MLKKIVCFSVSLFPLCAFADMQNPPSIDERLNALEMQVFSKVSAEGNNVFEVFGEFLYWRANVSGLPYALTHTDVPVPGLAGVTFDTNQVIQTVHLGYEPGYRVGAAYRLPFDQWDLAAIWTAFSEDNESSVQVSDTLDVHTVWDSTNTASAHTASAKLFENLKVIDVTFGKTISPSQLFDLRYYLGTKGAWLKEKLKVNYNGAVTDSDPAILLDQAITIHNDFASFGLLTGLNALWNLHYGFGIYSKGELAALWGRFDLHQHEDVTITSPSSGQVPIDSHFKQYAVKMNFVVSAGIKWSVDLWQDCLRLTLNAGYEFNYWPNQLVLTRMLTVAQNSSGGVAYLLQQPGDVGFQGYNFGASLQF